MRPVMILRVEGDVCVGKDLWHSGSLMFFRSPNNDSYIFEVYYHSTMHMPYFSKQFSPGQLRNYPPRTFSNRSVLFFTFDDGTNVRIKSSATMLSKLARFLNDIKDSEHPGGFSHNRNNCGNLPYARSYAQKQFEASKRNDNYIHRHSPVVKSPNGHRMLQNSPMFRHPKDSRDFTLEIIGERTTKSSEISVHSFFGSSEKNRNFGGNRTPLKMLTTNANQDHSKRPKQLDLDTSKRPKLTCDMFSKEGGQLGGQLVKDTPTQKPCNLSDKDTNGMTAETSPYIGFPNIGNSCFMNSVLQSLLQLRCISDDLDSTRQALEKSLPEQSVIRYLLALLSCPPEDCTKLLGQTLEVISNTSPCFADGQQHDALEFLVQLLDAIKEEVKKASTGNCTLDPVTRNIEFQLGSSYMCQKCQRIIYKKEVLHMLSLNVPKLENSELSSLSDALKDYFDPQVIEMKCERCSGTSTKCVQGFSVLPRVLVFHLKRYTYLDGTCKIMCPVQVPIHLSLEEFVLEQGGEQSTKSLVPSSTSSVPAITEDESLLVSSPSPSSSFKSSPESSTVSESLSSVNSATNRTPVKINTVKIHQCSMPGRKVLNNLHPSNPNVPIVLKGGSDSANVASPIPAIGSEVPVEKPEVNVMETISEETEEEQFEKVLKMSRESAQCQEDKELIEAMNRSVQDMSCNYGEETFESSQDESTSALKNSSDTENSSGPFSYQLASVVSHIGHNADTGHYVANYFDSHSGHWWHFNDEVVHRKSKHSVLESIKTQGYLFFYVSRDSSA